MKKLFFIFMTAALISGYVFGEDADATARRAAYTLSYGASLSMLFGDAGEYMYKDTGETLLSELRWGFSPAVYYGSFLEFSPYDPYSGFGFFGKVSASSLIPGKAGTMSDKDWNAASGNLETRTSHNNDFNSSLLLDIDAGVIIPFWILLKPLFRYSLMINDWTAEDGKVEEASIPVGNGSFIGSVIRYTQYWHLIYFGVSAEVSIGNFTIEPGILFSPLIVCSAEDNHYLRGIRYTDKSNKGISLEGMLKCGYSFNRLLSLNLDLGIRWITGSRGKSEAKDLSDGSRLLEGYTGSDYFAFKAGLTLRMRY